MLYLPISHDSQALRIAYENEERYRQILRNLAAAILLGTPHSSPEHQDVWQNTALLVQPSRLLQKKRDIATKDLQLLSRSSKSFDEADVSIPILSIYEKKEIKVKTGLGNKKTVVSMRSNFGGYRKFKVPFLSW